MAGYDATPQRVETYLRTASGWSEIMREAARLQRKITGVKKRSIPYAANVTKTAFKEHSQRTRATLLTDEIAGDQSLNPKENPPAMK